MQVHYLTVTRSEAQQARLVSVLWAPQGQNQGVGLAVFQPGDVGESLPTWSLFSGRLSPVPLDYTTEGPISLLAVSSWRPGLHSPTPGLQVAIAAQTPCLPFL